MPFSKDASDSSSSTDGSMTTTNDRDGNGSSDEEKVINEVELVGVLPPDNDVDSNDYEPSTRISSEYIPNQPGKIRKSEDNGSVTKNDKHNTPKKITNEKDASGHAPKITKVDSNGDSNGDDYDNDYKAGFTRSVSFCGKKTLAQMAAAKKLETSTEKRTSQWEELMRKFSEAHKEECKTVSLDIPRAPRSIKQFPTGSKYEGTWDLLGMSGYGTYTFPNGVVYEGDFEDGMFQGEGELRYPEGAILRGTWKKGHMIDKSLLFADGLEYDEDDWGYCKMPDRRFTIEYENGLQPGGKSYMTADQPTPQVPEGYYDTGDGFFDPKTMIVYSANNITNIVRSAGPLEAQWIVDNCRTSPDEAVGPRQELYEEWSEPQTNPEPPPPPAATTRAYRRDTQFSDDDNFDDDVFYETLRKSRTSCAPAARSCIGFSDHPITTLHFIPFDNSGTNSFASTRTTRPSPSMSKET